jgi:hypothetical protein
MSFESDRLFRRIWLVNGILLFLVPPTDQLVADAVLDSLAASAGRTLGRR